VLLLPGSTKKEKLIEPSGMAFIMPDEQSSRSISTQPGVTTHMFYGPHGIDFIHLHFQNYVLYIILHIIYKKSYYPLVYQYTCKNLGMAERIFMKFGT